MIAALCYACHTALDQGSKMSRQERHDMWEEAHRQTIKFLIENEYLIVNRNM
jgi:hypothetical protein